MESENRVFDECCEGDVVEEVGEVLPNISVAILPQTFIVESVDLCDLSRFVVASEKCDAITEANFERDKESEAFNGEVPTIHVVPEEEVVRVRHATTYSEELDKIVELSVDVTADCHRRTHRLHVRFRTEDLLRFLA